MVQLEVEVEEGVWNPVIRYDCAHNFAHRDRYNLKGDLNKEEIPLSFTDSLDLADKDINGNGMFTRNAFYEEILHECFRTEECRAGH